jgi:hypothetical protein
VTFEDIQELGMLNVGFISEIDKIHVLLEDPASKDNYGFLWIYGSADLLVADDHLAHQ